MRAARKVPAGLGELRERKGMDSNWECFLHTLLFQDDLHSVARNPYLKGSITDSVGCSRRGYSMISARRLINGTRKQDFSEIPLSKFDQNRFGDSETDPYFDALSEGICLVSEIAFSSQVEEPLSMKGVGEWKNSRSVYSISPFVEDRFPHSDCVSDMKLPHSFHPEASIRIFRRQVEDAPFPHPPRLTLRGCKELSTDSPREGKNGLATLLWNPYTYEIESLLMPSRKHFSGLQSESSTSTSDRRNIIWKQIGAAGFNSEALKEDSYPTKSSCIHYGRYENYSILAFGGTQYPAKRWIYYILTPSQFYFRCWLHPHRMRTGRLSRSRVPFPGYILGIQLKIEEIRVVGVDESYITTSTIRESLFGTPTMLLIESMARGNFCDGSGRLVSKLARTTWTDDEISERFLRLWKIISLYYGGSKNRGGLNRLRHILRLPCDKTSACKHKSTMRLIRRKSDSRIFLGTPRGNCKMTPHFQSRSISNSRRFWHLEITQPVSVPHGV
uniref:Maturase K n=1 Tax=Dipteris conjugata TaxID=32108 RepID=A0A385GPG8_9MONI|nr:maturase K [Dipteris conjugata]